MVTAGPQSPIDGTFPFRNMTTQDSRAEAAGSGSSIATNGSSTPCAMGVSNHSESSDSCKSRKTSLSRSLSINLIRATSAFRKHSNTYEQSAARDVLPPSPRDESNNSDVAGPRFRGTLTPVDRTAGDGIVYSETPVSLFLSKHENGLLIFVPGFPVVERSDDPRTSLHTGCH
jgi:hypothetical protein